jgi:DNA-directed RNA polymerase subunit RPC12/RpoP
MSAIAAAAWVVFGGLSVFIGCLIRSSLRPPEPPKPTPLDERRYAGKCMTCGDVVGYRWADIQSDSSFIRCPACRKGHIPHYPRNRVWS